jgi:predicted enzyme related to lactoylglutathione lyase
MAKVVHFEIPVDDAQRASAFYADALGWEISGWGDAPYWLVKAGAEGEPGADGALIARGDVHRSPVLILGVVDVDDSIAKVEAAGGLPTSPTRRATPWGCSNRTKARPDPIGSVRWPGTCEVGSHQRYVTCGTVDRCPSPRPRSRPHVALQHGPS